MKLFSRKKKNIQPLVERIIPYRGFDIIISVIDHPDDEGLDKVAMRVSWTVGGYEEYTITQADDLSRIVDKWKNHAETYINKIIDRPKIIQSAIDQLEKYLK
jgi:hypothetical protein